MLFVVTIISLLVHIYSTDYVHGDRRYTHYFAFLSLFTASMLFFVMSPNTLQMLIGLGARRRLLVRAHRPLVGGEDRTPTPRSRPSSPTASATSACIIGVIITVLRRRPARFNILAHQRVRADAGREPAPLLLVGVAAACSAAVMSKSGQFILHTWLPDAMAGPTPVSALIHAATMVVAGVYLVARLYSVFFEGLVDRRQLASTTSRSIGGVTVLFGGACWPSCRTTSRRCWPTRPISQLGYMVMALGVGAWTGGAVPPLHPRLLQGLPVPRRRLGEPRRAPHLRHAEDMGGLKKYMPTTFWTFIIGTARAHRHLPARRLLVEGRDPGRLAQRPATAGAYHVHAGHGPHRRAA